MLVPKDFNVSLSNNNFHCNLYRKSKGKVVYTTILNNGFINVVLSYPYSKIPSLSKLTSCKELIPCNVDYLNWFGFITIPMLAFVAFLLITILVSLKK